MRILKVVGGVLALIGGIFFIIASLFYLHSSEPLYISWFAYLGCGLLAIVGGIWAILGDIVEVNYSGGNSLLLLADGILTLLFGLTYYLTSDFTFVPISFFVNVLNLFEPLAIFGIPIESIFILTAGLLILWIKDENKSG
jgi:hypothetical protein